MGVLAAILMGVGCSREAGRAPESTPAPAAFTSVHSALCDSARAAEAGDSATAEARFIDAHGGLHDLAAAVEAEDRGLAARLLEAKEKVEAAGAGPEERRDLAALAAEAIEAAGGVAPERCAG